MDLNKLRPSSSADVAGKRVLVRADLNVPVRDGRVSDATRIERFVPTVRDLASRGAKVIVLSHFGRPKGAPDPDMSLRPIAEALGTLVPGLAVSFAEDCIGEAAANAIAEMRDGDVLVLENTRFHAEEEKNTPAFVHALADNGDIYVNDAFSCAHRAHASTAGLANVLPAFVGGQMMAEIDALRVALEDPERPVAALVGGAKVSTKIPVLSNLVARVDRLIIGGGMANTFLHANGIDVGKSLCEPDFAETAREIQRNAEEKGCELVLPIDAVIAREFRAGAPSEVVAIDAIPTDAMMLDVGPATIVELKQKLSKTHTLLWNGPLGAFEIDPFGEGTFAVAREAARLTREGKLKSIAGGGDTVAALNAAGVTGAMSYVSTAGGAFLEWLEGRKLPGVAALVRGDA